MRDETFAGLLPPRSLHEKDPSLWEHAGVSYAHIPHGRAGGGWDAAGIFEFEPGNCPRLYQTAHLKRRWISEIFFLTCSSRRRWLKARETSRRPSAPEKLPSAFNSELAAAICEILRACLPLVRQSQGIVSHSPRWMSISPYKLHARLSTSHDGCRLRVCSVARHVRGGDDPAPYWLW